MAEPIGVTAGLIAIVTFAFQISREVYDVVRSIEKAPQTITDLKSELLSLSPTLASLQKMVEGDPSQFEELRYPLHQCGIVCFHLRSLIRKCTEHSVDGSRSARDWVKLQYEGKTIDGYKVQLASYKATIGIAMQTFELSNGALTAKAVDEIKAMLRADIGKAQPDLEREIQKINEKLNTFAIERAALTSDKGHPTNESTEIQRIQEREKVIEEDQLALEIEKKAMEQSRHICTEATQRVESAHPQPTFNVTMTAAHNQGFALAQNSGNISGLSFGTNRQAADAK